MPIVSTVFTSVYNRSWSCCMGSCCNAWMWIYAHWIGW